MLYLFLWLCELLYLRIARFSLSMFPLYRETYYVPISFHNLLCSIWLLLSPVQITWSLGNWSWSHFVPRLNSACLYDLSHTFGSLRLRLISRLLLPLLLAALATRVAAFYVCLWAVRLYVTVFSCPALASIGRTMRVWEAPVVALMLFVWCITGLPVAVTWLRRTLIALCSASSRFFQSFLWLIGSICWGRSYFRRYRQTIQAPRSVVYAILD